MSKGPDLHNDSPWLLMKRLSLPGILGMMVLSISSLVDALYLGNLVSTEAFAGVSLLFPMTLVVTSITGFIAVGSSSVLSRAIGAKDQSIQQLIIPNLIALSLIGSGILIIVGILFSKDIVSLLGAEGQVYQSGVDYLQIYLCGAFFSVYGLAANGLIRSEGKIKQAMTYTVVAVVANIILTPLFIQTLNLGVKGAAWSSVASMVVYSLLTSAYFIRGNASFKTGKFAIRVEKEIASDVVSIGFSSLTMQISNVVRQFIIFRSITYYGTTHDLAVFSAAYRLFSFISIPAMGLLQPLQPVIGINYGAGNWQRCVSVLKYFRWGGVIFMASILIPFLIFPDWFIGLMIPEEPLRGIELHYIRLVFLALPFLPISTSAIIYFQAVGNSRKATMIPLARQAVLFLPLIFALPYFLGLEGIYYSLVIENILYASILLFVLEIEMQKLQSKTSLNCT
ncbi:MATE family efflux transporter [Fulvivirga sp. RKSG066]|uniref:MATE family efflux transporter n=1 Tax=Fulvivirga aurantia TaxID=2529383 RepID=UPI0012BD279B|nr:MATE family efflux transporter [Fulvivirga aurantia]MTI22865.1 MATE family efflux transporter [Fulvivirga aurantia]